MKKKKTVGLCNVQLQSKDNKYALKVDIQKLELL